MGNRPCESCEFEPRCRWAHEFDVEECKDWAAKEIENVCRNCEYWLEKYQQCEHPEQRQEECGKYMAPPNKTCELWESAT